MKAWINGAIIGFIITLVLAFIGRNVFALIWVAAPLTILGFFFMNTHKIIVGIIAWSFLPIIGALTGLLISKIKSK